jgi:hypothetical protein
VTAFSSLRSGAVMFSSAATAALILTSISHKENKKLFALREQHKVLETFTAQFFGETLM